MQDRNRRRERVELLARCGGCEEVGLKVSMMAQGPGA
jgi:hypothetical protein